MLRNFELEKDEKNVFIRTKARYTAFWISWGYIAIAIIIESIVNLNLHQFLIITLCLMSVLFTEKDIQEWQKKCWNA